MVTRVARGHTRGDPSRSGRVADQPQGASATAVAERSSDCADTESSPPYANDEAQAFMDQDDSHVEPAALGKSDSGLDFREFFEGEYRRLAKALFLMTGDPFEADELAQEALVRVFERWDRVRVMASPAGYLYRTALNLSRSRVRRLASRAKHVLALSPQSDPLAGVEARDEVRRLLAALPRGQREAVILVEWLAMSAEQAGAILGIDASTVRVQLSRARKALRTAAATRDE